MTTLRTFAIGSSVAAMLATGVMLAPAANAQGGGGGGVSASGNCSMSADWTLKAKHDDGRIEVQFEVDSNVAGQNWAVRITDNGTLVARARATTVAPSGSFDFRRLIPNQAGSDTIVATATRAASGETCHGRVVLG